MPESPNALAQSPTFSANIFIGTYTKTESRGIYSVTLDLINGRLTAATLVAETRNPSFLALSPDNSFLYAVSETPELAVPFRIGLHRQLTALGSSQLGGQRSPCHLSIDRSGRVLLLTHFGQGYVAALPIHPDGTLGTARVIHHQGRGFDPERQSSPHPHSVTLSPDNRYAIVCDLGLDRVFSYALDLANSRLTAAETPYANAAPGAGPRHSAFSPDGRHLYVLNELSGTVAAYAYNPACGALTYVAEQSTLPATFTSLNTTAEVRIHPSGRFVYCSNRGHDSIAVFVRSSTTGHLTRVEIVACGGEHPRHFSLSPNGDWLVCANMTSNSLTVFRVDADTGRLARVPGATSVPMPVCVLFRP